MTGFVVKNMMSMMFLMTLKTIFIMILMSDTVHAKEHNSLMDKHIKVAAIPDPFYTTFYCNEKEISGDEECQDKDNETYGGVLWEFLELVKKARNVTITIVRPQRWELGLCHGKNNCTGMIGMVNRKEVDFALGN